MGKKVLHIALTRGAGGVDVYVRSLIKHSRKDDENVIVCSSDFANGCFPKGVKHYIVDVPREISIAKDLKASTVVSKIIKDEKPDVVYCHSSMAGAVGRFASIGKGAIVLYNPHGWSFNIQGASKKSKFVYRQVERVLAWFTDAIICVSESEKQVALQNKVCRLDKLHVISNGIDLSRACPETPKDTEFFTIGCAARLSEAKDPLLFSNVMRIVAGKESRARFVWVGDGELRDSFEKELEKDGIKDKTVITGWLDNPNEEISKFDLAVLLSKWEGFGLCLADYLANGKPIVALNSGGIGEIVNENVGILLNTRNPEEIADAILSMRDLEKRKEFSLRCIDQSTKYDVKNTSKETWELIETLYNK